MNPDKPFSVPRAGGLSPLAFFGRPEISAPLSRLLLLSVLHLLLGCNYYRTRSTEPTEAEQLNVIDQNRILILHQGDEHWRLTNPIVEGEELKGTLSELPAEIAAYAQPRPGGGNRYKHADRGLVRNLVHIYINEYRTEAGNTIGIPMSAIKRIDVVERDTDRTIASHVGTGALIAVGTLAILYIIVLLTKSSCPFVYAYHSNDYEFIGEAYGGAIFAPIERDDYMPLPPLQAVNGQYLIQISNELKERQYTNLAQLWAVNHPDSVQVLLDSAGKVYTIARLQAPLKAISHTGESFLAQVVAKDSSAYLFHEEVSGNQLNELELIFARPAGTAAGKLVLRAQNSLWLDYLFGEFTKKFGSLYNRWAISQRTETREKLSQWQWDQGIPLSVYLDTPAGWQRVGAVPSVGPLAARDLVIPVNLSQVASRENVKIKLAGGFMFWELDYAAMDFSPNVPVELENYPLQGAFSETGREVSEQLRRADSLYLAQAQPGTFVSLAFRAPAGANAYPKRTFFLQTRGYYEHEREYTGMPDLAELYSFRKPGRFIEFSREKHREVMHNLGPTVTTKR
jgi:hypothetical protein